MGRIDVELEDPIIKEFKIVILRRMGVRRGSMRDALHEAINLWLNNNYVRTWYQDDAPLSPEYERYHSGWMKEFKSYVRQE